MAASPPSSKGKLVLTAGPSPISAETVALAGVSFSNLLSHENEVFFACRDPNNMGKTSVKSLETGTTTTPKPRTLNSANVRSAVHEYGGGAFTIGPKGEGVVYTDFPSYVVYWEKAEAPGEPQRVYPPDEQASPLRFADFSVVEMETDAFVICIMEDHTDPAPSKVVNSLVSISLDGKGTITTLASGHDFYAYPQVNSDKTKLAFVAWDHPNMPWDGTTLYVQHLKDLKPVGKPFAVHGQDECGKRISVTEPRWSPKDDGLYFLSDVSGWYNLYHWQEELSKVVALYPRDADFCGGGQGWILGLTNYTFLADGTLITSYSPAGSSSDDELEEDSGSRVVMISLENDRPAQVREFGRSCFASTSISSVCATEDEGIYFIGGSTMDPPSIWRWERPGDESCVAQEVVPSLSPDVNLDPIREVFSIPKLVKFPSDNSGVGYGYGFFYPPSNLSPDLVDFKPPLLVKAHGGPTSRTSTTFRLDLQFWTSRGFSVLDVDYGGSTGYGSEYRQSLRDKWGVIDVADVSNGARWCVEEGLVNGDWLCIDGGSAGGYTTLAALTFGDVFSAGASKYGVSDLTTLYTGTHKFESRYMDGLIGPYPQEEALYKERCPIHFVDKLNCPLLLLQGDEDKVVPPDQAEVMFKAMHDKSLPSTLVIYKGEQHGFRKSENIRHALNSEYDFFCQTFGFEANKEDGFNGIPIGKRIEV